MKEIDKIRAEIKEGQYREILTRLYGNEEKQQTKAEERIEQVLQGFCRAFEKNADTKVCVFSAPGRTEIGGNHTDHQRGKVLTGAVDLDALCCAAPNASGRIRIFSEGYGMTEIPAGDWSVREEEKNSTAALVRGVAAGIAGKGYFVGGFDLYMISDVPGGSGLSSSACFEVLTGTVINHLFCSGALPAEEIAKIGQFAENVYFGKPSGLMDQMGCAIGGAVAIDFYERENPRIHPVACETESAGYALCIIDTGADHADLTADYAAVPAEMSAVAAAFGKEVLSEVPEQAFYQRIPELRRSCGDRAVLRAMHFFAECERVEQETAALENHDFGAFLALVNASGRSSYMYLQNIATFRKAEEQPVAVALAAAEHFLNGRGAVRVHGGGFAGTIQAFVPLDALAEFTARMDALLGEGACKATRIRPAGGCLLMG